MIESPCILVDAGQFNKICWGLTVAWPRVMRIMKKRTTNKWLADDDRTECNPEQEPITEEEFARRIFLTEFSVSSGGRFTAWYGDDGMFWSHEVTVDGMLKKDPWVLIYRDKENGISGGKQYHGKEKIDRRRKYPTNK